MLGTDFFLQLFEIYGYTQSEMRKTLVCKFFFTLKLWPDKVFIRRAPTVNHTVIIWLSKMIAQTLKIKS